VIEFPSTLRAWYDSDEYAPLIALPPGVPAPEARG
jgi:hypothetical protein